MLFWLRYGDKFLDCFLYLRCSSITFDLTDAEGYNRNRSKSRRRREKERKEKESQKEESQANIFAREEEETIQRQSRPGPSKASSNDLGRFGRLDDEEDDLLSKWSCRRCTLENPLQESVCMACGGSRLSSIGDIEVPRIVEPRNLVNLIEEEEIVIEKDDKDNNNIELMKWKCKTCTLENEPFNFYCDACNSPNPRRDKTRKDSNQDENAGQTQNPDMWLLLNKVVR